MADFLRVNEDRKKLCSCCSKTFKKGEIAYRYCASAFQGNRKMRWKHLSCFVEENWFFLRRCLLPSFVKKKMTQELLEGHVRCSECLNIIAKEEKDDIEKGICWRCQNE